MSCRLSVALAVGLALAFGAGACGGGGATDQSADAPEQGPDSDDGATGTGGGGGPEAPEAGNDGPELCSFDSDCEPAAATCCECPTFALPIADGYGAACEDVECPGPTADDESGSALACAPTAATCRDGACRLVCVPVACDIQCEFGFAPDAAGCLRCDESACAPPAPAEAECVNDADCARVPADCCGCARGGADTAVGTDRVDEHLESLECDASPSCPEVNVCDAERVPRCFDGVCDLGPAEPADVPPGDPGDDPDGDLALCGTPGLTCPDDTVCVLNDPEAQAATGRGLGVCRRP